MTFRSLIIESHPNYESAHTKYASGVEREIAFSLNAYTFQASAERFGNKYGLSIEYVDNAWARIAVKGKMLKSFLMSESNTEFDFINYCSVVDDDVWYVINEEEL